ncbi:MAG: copper resistance protein B [Gammaproteobacteria bacterium]
MRDPHAYADGYDFGPIPRPRFADERSFGSLLVDRLEWVHTTDNNTGSYDLQAWYGRDYNRAVLKAEGDVDNGKLQDARTELLWDHAVASFWDMQLGMRYDSGAGPDRSWLAFGFQGLAPYWFEVDATAYVRDAGHSALRISADYELLVTQKLILQPRFEVNFYGKEDAARDLAAGLSDLTAGMRLRYEIRHEFAPYVGIEWVGTYGGTANYVRAAGDPTKETRYVAGLRFWF